MVSKFVKGSSTFKCACCTRLTRFTGDQAVGAKVCPQCWDLAGYENQLSDDGQLDAQTGAHVNDIFHELFAKDGVDMARVQSEFEGTLWDFYSPKAKVLDDALLELVAAQSSGFTYATRAELAAMDADTRAAYRKARRAAAKAARKGRGQ